MINACMFPSFSLADLMRSEPQMSGKVLLFSNFHIVCTWTAKPLSLLAVLWGKRVLTFSSENTEPQALGVLFPNRSHVLISKMEWSQIMYVKHLTVSDSQQLVSKCWGKRHEEESRLDYSWWALPFCTERCAPSVLLTHTLFNSPVYCLFLKPCEQKSEIYWFS